MQTVNLETIAPAEAHAARAERLIREAEGYREAQAAFLSNASDAILRRDVHGAREYIGYAITAESTANRIEAEARSIADSIGIDLS
jgi:hypothetical protein